MNVTFTPKTASKESLRYDQLTPGYYRLCAGTLFGKDGALPADDIYIVPYYYWQTSPTIVSLREPTYTWANISGNSIRFERVGPGTISIEV